MALSLAGHGPPFGVKLSGEPSLLAIKPANLYVKDHLGGLTSAVHFVGA